MIDKKAVMFVTTGLLIAGGVIGWLFSSKVPVVDIEGKNGVKVRVNASMTNSVIEREKDGVKLWSFTVAELEQDRKANKAYLKGIKGKVFRKDGTYIDITAESGEATLNKKDNNFSVSGKVLAVASDGGKLEADRVDYVEKSQFIKATGHVHLVKDENQAWGDVAETTAALEKFKLKGHAKVEKGGK